MIINYLWIMRHASWAVILPLYPAAVYLCHASWAVIFVQHLELCKNITNKFVK